MDMFYLLFSCSVMSDSAAPWMTAQQACLSFTVSQGFSNPCPLSQCRHPPISSSVVPFFSCPQSFPASVSFPVRRLFASGGQSVGASGSVSALPMTIQGWFPLGLTGLISLQSKGPSEPSPEPQFESINSSACLQCGFWTVRYQLPYLQENSKHLGVEISGPIFTWWPWHWADTATYTECKKVFVELSRRATSVVTDKRLYYKMRNSVTRCRKPHGINLRWNLRT